MPSRLVENDVTDTDEAAEATVEIAVAEPFEEPIAPEHTPETAPEPMAETERAAEPDEPSVAESGDPGYVPMSEWLDDFDRR